MGQPMGLNFGLESNELCYKRKFRFLFSIPGVSAETTSTLPPSRSARPSLAFREIEVQHLTETIFLPGKPEWKTVSLTLYDVGRFQNPVFEWIRSLYDPADDARYDFPVDARYFKEATVTMLSGGGDVLETWIYENCWLQACDFGELDMGNNEVVMCDLTLRYARAYIVAR